MHTEFGYRVLLGDDHPAVRTLDGLLAEFGGGLPLWLAWECGDGHPCASALDSVSLRMAQALARELAALPDARSVRGPADAPILAPDASGFAVRHLVENGEVASDAQALAALALSDPLWLGDVVSADGSVGAIVVEPRDSTNATAVAIVEAAQAAIQPHQQAGFAFHLMGDPVTTVVAGRELAESSAALVPVCAGVIALVLYALLRSLRAVAMAMATMGIALLWTLGLLGWLGWPRDGILEVLAPLLLIVGVCDAVHLLARVAARDGAGASRAAVLGAARDVAAPCLLTTLTTAAAFLSFATSPLDAFVRFGVVSAFGVSACLVLSFSLLPVLALRLPAGSLARERAAAAWRVRLDALAGFARRRSLALLLAGSVALGVCGFGWWAHLRVDQDWNDSFGAQSRVVRWRRFFEARLRPTTTLQVRIALPARSALEEPETLDRIRTLGQRLSALEGLGAAESVVDLLGRLNRALHADDPAFERAGETRGANAELLELLAFEDPALLGSWVALDRSSLRLAVESGEIPFSTRTRVLEQVRREIARTLPADWRAELSGSFAIGFDWIRDVRATQLRSFPVALAVVFLLAALFLRSPLLALAAVLPSLLAVVVTLGAMGWAGMSLDVGRAMVAAVVLGIGVDDGLHLLDHYRRRRAAGGARGDAIRDAVVHTGRALVTTSAALALGFLALTGSAWQTIASFGLCVALAMVAALAATLLGIPALVFAAERLLGPAAQRSKSSAPRASRRPRNEPCR